ncbi:MAG: DUF2520 domain-containing protein [Ferruginibacter sp.]
MFAISDNALYELDEFNFGNKIALHTAGSVSIDVLKNISANYGVLYPLQSLRKERVTIPEIPLLINGNTEDTISEIENFAKTISPLVSITTDKQREKLHLAAVIVNNFANHLFTMTEDYCIKEKLDFNMLFPLINETAQRLHYYSPAEMQTGPAIRKDTITIDKHLKLLSDFPELKYIYTKLSESINRLYS